MTTPWSPNGVPFCWLPKKGLRRIDEGLEEEHARAATLIYLALARIASDEESPLIEKSQSYIAKVAYMSRTTVWRHLGDLEKLGLIKVTPQSIPGTKARLNHRIELVSLCNKVVSPPNNVVSQPGLPRETLTEEQKKGRRNPVKPLTTSERISAERSLTRTEAALKDHRGTDNAFRDEAWVRRRDELTAQIEGLQASLERGAA